MKLIRHKSLKIVLCSIFIAGPVLRSSENSDQLIFTAAAQDLSLYPIELQKAYFPLQHQQTLRTSHVLSNEDPLPPRLSDLSYHDLQALFSSALTKEKEQAAYKPSFTFMSIDLKYTTKKEIKILEFNAGKTSGTFGYQRLYGPGIVWGELWEQLAKLSLRPYVVSKQPIYSPNLLRHLNETGGAWAPTLDELTTNPQFEQLASKQHPKTLADFSGIVIYRYRERIQNHYERICHFRSQYPNLLTLDEISSPYQRNKLVMSMLFEHAGLQAFRPKYRAYQKKYTPALANTISRDFSHASKVVIKPFDSSQGYGIIIVDHQHLDTMLRAMLSDGTIDASKIPYNQRDIDYWRHDKNEFLMVEEFISSKPIIIDEKPYDPTMRVFCSLHNDRNGEIVCNTWGYYWKLPSHPLDAPVNFNDRHKSNIHGGPSSARVGSLDRTIVHEILSQLLPEAYKAMHHIDHALGLQDQEK